MVLLKDQDIQRYIKKSLLVIGGFLVIAFGLILIFQENHQIVLKKNEVEYQSEVKVVDLVDSIGKTKIQHDQTVSSNTIVLETYEVSFDDIDTNRLGKQSIKAVFSDETIESQTLEIIVKDTKKPSIEFLVKKGEVLDLRQVKNKDFSNLFKVKDNHTKENDIQINTSIDKKNIQYGDSFILTVVAKDQSNNETKAKIRLQVKEKKKEVPKKEEMEEAPTNQNKDDEQKKPERQEVVEYEPSTPQQTVPQIDESTQTPQQPQAQEPVSPPVQPKPSNKRYMFTDGYDMSSAPQACQNDLFASSYAGACVPLQDENGIYIGMELQFY